MLALALLPFAALIVAGLVAAAAAPLSDAWGSDMLAHIKRNAFAYAAALAFASFVLGFCATWAGLGLTLALCLAACWVQD